MTEEPYWPETVKLVSGMAPGELRLLEKVAGGALESLSPPDQVKASVFIALFRLHRDEDPGVIWDQAEWTQVEPERGGLVPLPNLPAGGA
jgi:hypothetical protein